MEAAFTTIAFFFMILLLVQPVIWLYTRMVMSSAAGETARLLATMPESSLAAGSVAATSVDGADADKIRGYAKRRLQAVPPVAYFKVGGRDAWTITWTGNPSASEFAEVTISVRQTPMPLVGILGKPVGLLDANGNIVLTVKAKVPAKDAILQGSPETWGAKSWAW